MIKKNTLLFNRFLRLIEDNHLDLTERFMNDLLKNPDTVAYRNLNREAVYEASNLVFRDLSKWIDKGFEKSKIEERYSKLGRERFNAGIPFSQTQKSLVLQKRYLWICILENLDQDQIAYKEAMDLSNSITVYFDRAVFFMLKGYEEVLFKGM